MESLPDQTCPCYLKPSEVLYHQGQSENHIYVIESGHLKLEHVNAGRI